jgi:hypothetical protein
MTSRAFDIPAGSCGRGEPHTRLTVWHIPATSVLLALLALLGVPNFDVDLEFSGSVSEACFIDVAAHVPVDSGQSVAELGRCWEPAE